MRMYRVLLLSLVVVVSSRFSSRASAGLMLVSEKEEIQIGKQAAAQSEKEYGGVLHDARRQARLNRVVAKIHAQQQRKNIPYTFKILNDDKVINAFAVPGGPLYITKKLLDMCETDGELAFIVGHEFAHTELQHGRKAINKAVIAQTGFQILLGKSSEAVKLGVGIAWNIIESGYSRDQERDADAWGVRYMVNGGWDPYEAVRALEMLGGGKRSGLSKYFSSHPATSERVQLVRRQIAAAGTGDDAISPGEPQPAAAEPKNAHPKGVQEMVQVSRVELRVVESNIPQRNLEEMIASRAARVTKKEFVISDVAFGRNMAVKNRHESGEYEENDPTAEPRGQLKRAREMWDLTITAGDSEGGFRTGFGNYRNRVNFDIWKYEARVEIYLSPSRLSTGIYQKDGTVVMGIARGTQIRDLDLGSYRLSGWGYYESRQHNWQKVQQAALAQAIDKLLAHIASLDPVDHVATRRRRLAERQAREKASRRPVQKTPGAIPEISGQQKLGMGRIRLHPHSAVKPGDILIARVKATREEIGRVRIVKLGDLAEYEIVSLKQGWKSIPQDPSVYYSRP